MKMRGAKCEECGGRTSLEVHHLNYDRLGCELPGDLKILCYRCHREADARRRIDQQEKFERKRALSGWAKGFDTWCERVHGYPASCATSADVDDFNDWLERKTGGY